MGWFKISNLQNTPSDELVINCTFWNKKIWHKLFRERFKKKKTYKLGLLAYPQLIPLALGTPYQINFMSSTPLYKGFGRSTGVAVRCHKAMDNAISGH